jgi:hypothetical protein
MVSSEKYQTRKMKDSAVGVPPWLLQLGLPAVAGSIAVVFSHPLELTKVHVTSMISLITRLDFSTGL